MLTLILIYNHINLMQIYFMSNSPGRPIPQLAFWHSKIELLTAQLKIRYNITDSQKPKHSPQLTSQLTLTGLSMEMN